MRKPILVLALLGFSFPASAQVSTQTAFRQVSAEACGQLQPETCETPPPIEDTAFDGFAETAFATEDTGGFASVSMYQESWVADGSYGGVVIAEANVDGGGAATSTAMASSEYSVTVLVSEEHTFAIFLGPELILGAGSATARVEITVVDTSTSELMYSYEKETAGVDFVKDGVTLPIGTYEIRARAELSALGELGPSEAGIICSFDFTDFSPFERFIRGDCDGDTVFNGVVDGIFALNFQFIAGSPAPPCLRACDADANQQFNGLLDSLKILLFAFVPGTPPPPFPYPECDFDLAATLECEVSTCLP